MSFLSFCVQSNKLSSVLLVSLCLIAIFTPIKRSYNDNLQNAFINQIDINTNNSSSGICNSLNFLYKWKINSLRYNGYFLLYSNHPFNDDEYMNDKITHAVIMQHGNLRNAGVIFCSGMTSIKPLKSVLLIAPQFYIGE